MTSFETPNTPNDGVSPLFLLLHLVSSKHPSSMPSWIPPRPKQLGELNVILRSYDKGQVIDLPQDTDRNSERNSLAYWMGIMRWLWMMLADVIWRVLWRICRMNRSLRGDWLGRHVDDATWQEELAASWCRNVNPQVLPNLNSPGSYSSGLDIVFYFDLMYFQQCLAFWWHV